MTTAFECSVCLRLLHEPATLPCGHSFCRRCLITCLDHQPRCPSCRTDVPSEFSSGTFAVSYSLAEAVRRLHPEQAGERAAEEAGLPPVEADGLCSLPLFVLEPLLPGQVMQLNVFEPRYLLMMERCRRWIQGSAEMPRYRTEGWLLRSAASPTRDSSAASA